MHSWVTGCVARGIAPTRFPVAASTLLIAAAGAGVTYMTTLHDRETADWQYNAPAGSMLVTYRDLAPADVDTHVAGLADRLDDVPTLRAVAPVHAGTSTNGTPTVLTLGAIDLGEEAAHALSLSATSPRGIDNGLPPAQMQARGHRFGRADRI